MLDTFCRKLHRHREAALLVMIFSTATLAALAVITGDTHYSHPYFILACAVQLITLVGLILSRRGRAAVS